MILVNPSFKPVPCGTATGNDAMSLMIEIDGMHHLLSLIYRSPNASKDENQTILNHLYSARMTHPNLSWMIFCDFNLSDVNYDSSFTRHRDHLYDKFLDFFNDHLLTQIVHKTTRAHAILDLVLSSANELIEDELLTASLANSDHNAVIVSLRRGQSLKYQQFYESHRFFDTNHAAEVWLHVSWPDLFTSTKNIDEMVSIFMSVIDQPIPIVNRSRKRKNKQTRLPKNMRKLIYTKRESAGKHSNVQIVMFYRQMKNYINTLTLV